MDTKNNEYDSYSIIDIFSKNIFVVLFIITIFSIILKFSYYEPEIPLILDALKYFWYANDIAITGEFPIGHSIANNGWPIFLAPFFVLTDNSSFIENMQIQKIISIILSSITIFPLYYLLKKFVAIPFVIVGLVIFAIEPRLIQNSVLGITEPLYILLGIISLTLFLEKNQKFLYLSFLTVGLCTIVRSEAMFLIPVFVTIFLWKNSRNRKEILRLCLAIGIFILILAPISMIRIQTIGDDALLSRVIRSADYSLEKIINDQHEADSIQKNYLIQGFENYVLFVGWTMIPLFIILTPIGFVFIFKNRDSKKMTLLLSLGFLSIPIFYAISFLSDVRYLFIFYPIFCILSMIGLEQILSNNKHKQKILVGCVILIIISSVSFLELKQVDYNQQKESLSIARDIIKITLATNAYLPDSEYLKIASLEKNKEFPITYNQFKAMQIKIHNLQGDNLKEFLIEGKTLGITHLVVDDVKNSPYRELFLQDIFYNEEDYKFLKKVYDSHEIGFTYGVKVFEIDYNSYNLLVK